MVKRIKRNWFIISSILIFIILFFINIGNASWILLNSVNSINNISAYIPEWVFNNSGIDPGTVIEVDEDGNVTVNGEKVDYNINTDNNNDSYNNGDVSIKIEVDEEGNLVLSEFTTSNTSFWAILGSDIYLPTSIEIDGATYPITGVSEPLDISLTNSWVGNNIIHVPEGYTYLCDGAFASITNKATFNLPSTLNSIGSGVLMPARNVTQTINYASSQANWNSITKASDYENGRGSITINYNN